VHLFLGYSRLAEQKLPSLHLPGMVIAMLLCFLIVPGVLTSVFSHSIGRFFLALHALIIFSAPFSVWKGGSFEFLTTIWWRLFILFPLVLGLTVNLDGVLRLARVMAGAVLVLALLVLTGERQILGRVSMGRSRYGDPNDIAMVMLIAIPLWGFLAARPGTSLLARARAAVCVLPLLYVLARTGSRGGFLAATVVAIYTFFRVSVSGKVAFAGLSIVVVGFGLLAVPAHVRNRYLTFSTIEQVQDERLVAAVASTENRKYIFRRSIELTLQNPLLGVGIGMFPVAEHGVAVEEGLRRGNWNVTHNIYTQISSEVGIPALFCFLAILVGTWRAFGRVEKAASRHTGGRAREIASLAFSFKLSLLSLLVTGSFLSIAHDELFAFLPAIAVALEQAARREGLFPIAVPLRLAAPAPRARSRTAGTLQVGA
jgi:O-antigen ligase